MSPGRLPKFDKQHNNKAQAARESEARRRKRAHRLQASSLGASAHFRLRASASLAASCSQGQAGSRFVAPGIGEAALPANTLQTTWLPKCSNVALRPFAVAAPMVTVTP